MTIGGGVKTAGAIKAGIIGGNAFHLTPALLVAIIGGAISVAVSFGLHMTQENIDSIMKLVGLIASGLVIGGAAKSQAMLMQGTHPLVTAVKKRAGRHAGVHAKASERRGVLPATDSI